jgi:hydroxymethylpyrimidine pyrophosphatase-like HAD family hydrolase
VRFRALITDYDGTLAHHGIVSPAAIKALLKVTESGRKLVMVTGRELPDLHHVFPQLSQFHLIVAENGAVLYDPATKKKTVLAERPPDIFIQALSKRGVQPISVGDVIIATWQPHETTVLEVIKDLGLELAISFNKGAVMVLPSGVNKETGLKTALSKLDIKTEEVVGVGDGENDHAFLKACGCAVAVQNALPMLKAVADIVLTQVNGEGICELVDQLVDHDLDSFRARPNVKSST